MYTATRRPLKLAPARLASLRICRWTPRWREDSRSLTTWLVILTPPAPCRNFRTTVLQPLEVAQSEVELPLWKIASRRTFARCLVVATLLSDLPGLIRWFGLEALLPSRTSRSPSDPACPELANVFAVLLRQHRATNFRLSILHLVSGDLVCGRVS
jgi:hypothetical protein